jgi:hypothetical protein
MKVSTSYDNPTAGDQEMAVIIFYCSPAHDKNRMMEIGHKLLEQFPYKNKSGFLYYKSDAQTHLGTRATGIFLC